LSFQNLNTLLQVKQAGMRAVMLYVIQRSDVSKFAPAKHIDPDYAAALKTVFEKGVEIIPVQAKVSPQGVEIVKELPYYPDEW